MMMATHPGAQTERRGGAGPVRGILGGKTSPAALFLRRTILPIVFVERTIGNIVLRIAVRYHFATGPRDQPGQDADVHADLQEPNMAVHEHGIGAAVVKSIDLPVIGAI